MAVENQWMQLYLASFLPPYTRDGEEAVGPGPTSSALHQHVPLHQGHSLWGPHSQNLDPLLHLSGTKEPAHNLESSPISFYTCYSTSQGAIFNCCFKVLVFARAAELCRAPSWLFCIGYPDLRPGHSRVISTMAQIGSMDVMHLNIFEDLACPFSPSWSK